MVLCVQLRRVFSELSGFRGLCLAVVVLGAPVEILIALASIYDESEGVTDPLVSVRLSDIDEPAV